MKSSARCPFPSPSLIKCTMFSYAKRVFLWPNFAPCAKLSLRPRRGGANAQLWFRSFSWRTKSETAFGSEAYEFEKA